MRANALLAALLALSGLAGIAAADPGPSEPDGEAADGRKEDGGAAGNQTEAGPSGNGTAPPARGNGSSERPASPQRPPPRECSREMRHEARERCRDSLCSERPQHPACRRLCDAGCDEARTFVRGMRHPVSFSLLPDRSGLTGYTVGPVLAISEASFEGMERAEVERDGAVLKVRADDTRLEVHDLPAGLLRFRSEDAALSLVFPPEAQVEARPEGGRVTYPAGQQGILVAKNATWLGISSVRVTGFASFHIVPPDAPRSQPLADATQRGRIGAEIELRPQAERPVQVIAYDDLEVDVQLPQGGDRTVRIELAANVTEGRTVALDLDPSLVGTSDPGRILMRYFTVHEGGGETEVVFHRAGSLADVLDPGDDGGQPEFWVVADGDGLHVMVSVPHWSVHAITVQGLGDIVQPSVLVGAAAGAAGIVAAAVAMFWPRRR